MAATWISNVTLSPENDYSAYIECCKPVGAYIVIVNSEIPEGCHAIFHITSAHDGQKNVKRTSSTSGNNGEQVTILWAHNHQPVLCYLSDIHAPQERRHYNIKVI